MDNEGNITILSTDSTECEPAVFEPPPEISVLPSEDIFGFELVGESITDPQCSEMSWTGKRLPRSPYIFAIQALNVEFTWQCGGCLDMGKTYITSDGATIDFNQEHYDSNGIKQNELSTAVIDQVNKTITIDVGCSTDLIVT